MSVGPSHRGFGAVGAVGPSSLRQPRLSTTLTRAEHGSAERGRVRERDRPRNTRPTDAPTFVRFNSVGEQETMDWLDAFGKVENSVETMARDIRLLSQTLTQMNTEYTTIKSTAHETVKDIALYNDYVQGRFDNIEKVTAERLLDADQRINNSASFSSELNVKLQQADIQINSILDLVHQSHFCLLEKWFFYVLLLEIFVVSSCSQEKVCLFCEKRFFQNSLQGKMFLCRTEFV